MKIICGTSNKVFANSVVALLDGKYQEIKVTSTKFSDGESYIELQDEVNDDSVTLIQSICGNDSLMELLLLIDVLKNLSVKNIVAVVPYFGYARQDRTVHPRSPITIRMLANILMILGVTKIITVDLHSKAGERFFSVPLVNLSTTNIFCDHYKKFYHSSNAIVVAPDVGAKERNTNFAIQLGVEVAVINKGRLKPGVSEVISMECTTEVHGKDVIIIDDIVDSAGTLCNSVDFLKNMGAKSVIAYVTHAVFSKNAIQRINASNIDQIYTTNSIMHSNIISTKIKILSLVELISENI